MSKNKWTRNQKILLIGLIISILGITANFYFLFQTSNKQVIINQDLNELKAKIGEFDQLVSNNFSTNNIKFTCPPGTEVKEGFMTAGELGVTCGNISSE